MRQLLLNTWMWIAVAFFVLALIDLGRDGSVWIVWFFFGMVFVVFAYRAPKKDRDRGPADDATQDDPRDGG